MKILREGDKGVALVVGRGRVPVVYEYRPVLLETSGVTVPDVLVGVDPETDEILVIPAQSTPKLKTAREARKDRVLSVRVTRELEDVLNLVAEHFSTESDRFSASLIRFYLVSAGDNAGLARRLGRLSKDRLACGKRQENLRLRVRADVHELLTRLVASHQDVNKSDLVRGAILAAKQDVLDGRAKQREKALEAVAQAV